MTVEDCKVVSVHWLCPKAFATIFGMTPVRTDFWLVEPKSGTISFGSKVASSWYLAKVMSSYLKPYSTSASNPSYAPIVNIPVPSFLNAITSSPRATWLYTTGVILLSLLVLEQSVYRNKKKHLPGSKWTIPVVGKLFDSMNPTMENYMKGWNSGALSALSVFNM